MIRKSTHTKKKSASPKRTVIAKGKSLPRGRVEELRKKPGMSNLGKYKNISPKDFAGPDGTYPINNLKHAKSALQLAHFAQNPSSIKRKVYAKYPSLKPKKRGSK